MKILQTEKGVFQLNKKSENQYDMILKRRKQGASLARGGIKGMFGYPATRVTTNKHEIFPAVHTEYTWRGRWLQPKSKYETISK
ncbi:MAG: hypothetical protein AYP45_08325 [Candidatus Brocadia carolinensis]|uniref:Uncharacterized protein n=1 Tax=Candidatus Brocadia carolinensis TaxID=1004156 RepID=A0A1V4AU43_9BACT|nr:MAG: hypothetical protein AYP45_08325 [Candidatus Brocadia caroliniensis]